MRIVDPSYTILTPLDGPAILRFIEQAGRTAYLSHDRITEDSAPKFVRMLISRGHESVLEHVSLSVRFVCDRGVSHELVRHRLAAFSQESTRYCNYSGEVAFVRPPFWDEESDAFWLWRHAMTIAEEGYQRLLDLGATPEQARSVLPNSLKTEVVMTANLREWRHVLRLRTSAAAHPQMRELMVPLLRELQQRVPVVFEDLEVGA